MNPAIYVACLAAYNHGYLHGWWIDANQDEEDIMEMIKEMLEDSPVKHIECCDEWAIHDYSDFEEISISEYEDIKTVSELGQAIAEHGEAMAAYYSHHGRIEGFEDAFCGEAESEEAFVMERFEESGQLEAIEKAGLESYYIDFAKMAYNWFINDFFSVTNDAHNVYVFSRN